MRLNIKKQSLYSFKNMKYYHMKVKHYAFLKYQKLMPYMDIFSLHLLIIWT